MKAVVFTLGCKVNGCESASLTTGLINLGYEVSTELGYADLYILNTCAVTQEAEKKSRQLVARVKKFNKNAKIIVCGCASEKSPGDFICKDKVTLVTGAKNKNEILKMLDKTGVFIDNSTVYGEQNLPPKNLKTRAFIKVQDGCNNFCSYCIIPYLRGEPRSRAVNDVVNEINFLSPLESVITGINLSAYNYEGVKLSGLINALSGVDSRIRLGSLEEVVVNEEFLTATKNLKEFAPHFHLSLQSGSDKVLKEMNRRYTTSEFLNSVKLIRSFYPNASITTDVIVGFSTETEEDFISTIEFCKTVEFADIHCFPFSVRKGTKAEEFLDLPQCVKKERLNRLTAVKNELKKSFILKNLNQTLTVIFEEFDGEYSVGYSENYIKVYIKGDKINKKLKVTAISPFNDGVLAEII